MLIPLSHWAHGRGAAHKLHIAALCGGLSRIPTDSLSLGGLISLSLITYYQACPTELRSVINQPSHKKEKQFARFASTWCGTFATVFRDARSLVGHENTRR